MKILLSNDDGYSAPGLEILAEHISKIADITVVAPESNRSGASNSLTLDRPLSVQQASNGFYYVNGTPTDCVHIALSGVMDTLPDMVVSGINDGANMGDDTLYSGTVAAATEGHLLGIPSIAVSMSQHQSTHFETAAKVVVSLIERYKKHAFDASTLINVNVPDIPYDQLQGTTVTRLGKRHKAEPVIKLMSPRGDPLYWIGAAGEPNDGGKGTDFYAIEHNQVSITPLQVDLTNREKIVDMNTWLSAGK